MTTANDTTLFDLSDHGKIELAGRDAREFLNNLCTQDVKNLAVRECREAFLTTAKARVIAHVWITRDTTDTLLLETAASQADKVLQHLNHYLISEQVEVTDRTRAMSMLRLVGPMACKFPVKTGTMILTIPQRLLGLDGVDLFFPAEDRAWVHEMFIEAGAVPASRTTYETLRIEAGLPEFGSDIDENRLAMEVNRPQAISYHKGCYLGQETIVMARDRGQVNRLLMGVKVNSDSWGQAFQPGQPSGQAGKPGPTPIPPGTKVLRAGEEVGQVTSSVLSPRLGQVIALAYLRRGTWDAGTEVVIDPPTDGRTAIVCALPFV